MNWRTYLAHRAPDRDPTFENFVAELKREYAQYTPEFAERETGVPAATIDQVAREIAAARPAFASHIWRAAAAGNLHGWQVTRALHLLNVLSGCIGRARRRPAKRLEQVHPGAVAPTRRRSGRGTS